jgi:hypothetical protein
MKPPNSPLDPVKAGQRAWAIRSGRAIDKDGYCGCVDDNVFQGLSVGARRDFESGDGTELGKPGERGKIQALHSSSALACNWFDYWPRTRFDAAGACLRVHGRLLRSRP